MNILDKTIEIISPQAGLKRKEARRKLEMLNSWESGGYGKHGASRRKNSLLGWLTSGGDADTDIVDNIETLRERSRDLFMGAPIATGALKTVRTNVVGSGLMLASKIDAEFLGLTEEQAIAWKKNTEREWRLWAETVDCDAERKQNFYQLQSLVMFSALMSGDVFVTMPIIKRIGSIYDLRIKLIEADRVCNPSTQIISESANIHGGVEIGEHGETIAYWIAKYNPDAAPRTIKQIQNEWKRVLAFGEKTGRRNILHVMADVERPDQRRGVPLLAPVIEALKQLSRYSEAELMAAVVSGMFTVFVTSNTPQTPLGGIGFDPANQNKEINKDNYDLGNGAIVGLAPGESISTANPGRPNANFDGFVTAICRQIGAALEIPYELLLKNFTASYSASRGALLEAWKMFRMRREWLIGGFCQPIYEEWLTEAILKGRIQAPGFFKDPAIKAAWCGAEWHGDAQGQLDPLKEANAAKVRVEEGFSTREKEAAEFSGLKYEDIHATRKREEEMRRADGLSGAVTALAPATSTGDNNDDNDDDE